MGGGVALGEHFLPFLLTEDIIDFLPHCSAAEGGCTFRFKVLSGFNNFTRTRELYFTAFFSFWFILPGNRKNRLKMPTKYMCTVKIMTRMLSKINMLWFHFLRDSSPGHQNLGILAYYFELFMNQWLKLQLI